MRRCKKYIYNRNDLIKTVDGEVKAEPIENEKLLEECLNNVHKCKDEYSPDVKCVERKEEELK